MGFAVVTAADWSKGERETPVSACAAVAVQGLAG